MKILKYTIGIIVALGLGLAIGYISGRRNRVEVVTTIIHDTIRVNTPEPEAQKYTGIEVFPISQVPVLLFHSDTIKEPYFVKDTLIIPIEQRYYTGESYKAWISGYNPKLDSLHIYQQTKIVTIDKLKEARNHLYLSAQLNYYMPTSMSLELQAGYTKDRLTYYIGAGTVTDGTFRFYGVAGLRYTILTKQW